MQLLSKQSSVGVTCNIVILYNFGYMLPQENVSVYFSTEIFMKTSKLNTLVTSLCLVNEMFLCAFNYK